MAFCFTICCPNAALLLQPRLLFIRMNVYNTLSVSICVRCTLHTLDCFDVARICWRPLRFGDVPIWNPVSSSIVFMFFESGWQCSFQRPHSLMYFVAHTHNFLDVYQKLTNFDRSLFAPAQVCFSRWTLDSCFVLIAVFLFSLSHLSHFSFHFYSFVQAKTVRKLLF